MKNSNGNGAGDRSPPGGFEKVDGSKVAADILSHMPRDAQARLTRAITEQDPNVAAKVNLELARNLSTKARALPAPEDRPQRPVLAPMGPVKPKALPAPQPLYPAPHAQGEESAADKLLKKIESDREQSNARLPSKKGYVA